ncbi:MFS transporter [Streptomyces sp. XM4193]|uniref:MFS transporter n=1 Tax=Streptomyces sp. XM4193 TaxID=2929782 RepID=UPI001FF7BF04|nr:MFS transporter [Streptomyces sp. XM4193]MCK1796742.1 MFS transporter [Streptomyces sp. XM4193]
MSRTALFTDVRPLRSSKRFRELWIGTSLGLFGGHLANVAVLLQVWNITGSPLWTGVIGLAGALPMTVFGLFGGALADAMDRRTLVALATSAQLLAAIGFTVQALAGNGRVLVLLGLVSLSAACIGLGSAARRTLPVRLLPGNELAAGLALQNFASQAAMLLGPAAAGFLIARSGTAAAYLVQTVAVAVSLLAVLRLPPMPRLPAADAGSAEQRPGESAPAPEPSGPGPYGPEPSGPEPGGSALGAPARKSWRPPRGGWRIITQRPTLWGSFATDLAATLLAMPISLFPLVNEARFDGDPRTLGLFLSSIAVGGICAGLLSGTYTRVRSAGRLQLAAALVWSLALATFGLAEPLWLVLGALVVAGAADTVSVVTRAALVQMETPDRFRGRVSSVELVIGAAGPELGNFRGGLVASLTSASFALASGGLLAAAVVSAIAAVNRPLRRYRLPPAQ